MNKLGELADQLVDEQASREISYNVSTIQSEQVRTEDEIQQENSS